MGAACYCAKESDFCINELYTVEAPSLFGVRDQYRLFELSLPFAQIDVDSFFQYMALATMDSSDGNSVTLSSLRVYLR